MRPTNTSRVARLCCAVALATLASQGTEVRAQTAAAESTPSPARLEEARERQRRARDLFANGSYNAALAEFDAVYGILEGHRQRHIVLLDAGQCHLRLGRFDLALRSYRRFLIEAPADANERTAVEADITRLEATLASLRVSTNVPNAEVWVDSRRVGTAPGEVLVPAGSHLVELRAPGHLPARREVQVAGRARVTLPAFQLESVAPRRGLAPAIFWSTAGAAVALAVVGGAVGLSALSAHADVQALQADPQRRFTVLQGDLDRVQERAVVADVFFGSAALVAVGAGLLYFLTDWGSRRQGPHGPLRTSISVTDRGATLSLAGSF
jgi:tetratricopeptide (TPR) repeat protein